VTSRFDTDGATASTHRVVLGLGSNLGDSLEHLQAGLDLLHDAGVHVGLVSPVYETAPIGGPEQGRFLNIVAVADTGLAPLELLVACQRVEAERDRVRIERWGPRTLDVDVIAIDDLVSSDPVLTLPHPRAAERAFVCVPWHDIEPEATIPGVGSLAAVLASLPDQDVVCRKDLAVVVPRSEDPS